MPFFKIFDNLVAPICVFLQANASKMEELVDYKTIQKISKAYINGQGKLIQKQERRRHFSRKLGKAFGAKYYYLPPLLICLVVIQILGFVGTFEAILKYPAEQQSSFILTACSIGIIPIVSILTIWFFIRPRKSGKRRKIKIEGIQYLLIDN